MSTIAAQKDVYELENSRGAAVDYDDFTTSSILEFLNKERECFGSSAGDEGGSDIDVESLFEEINRLSDNNDDRSVEEILREAELLLSKQNLFGGCGGGGGGDNAKEGDTSRGFRKIVQAVNPDPGISEESTPRDMQDADAADTTGPSGQAELPTNTEPTLLSNAVQTIIEKPKGARNKSSEQQKTNSPRRVNTSKNVLRKSASSDTGAIRKLHSNDFDEIDRFSTASEKADKSINSNPSILSACDEQQKPSAISPDLKNHLIDSIDSCKTLQRKFLERPENAIRRERHEDFRLAPTMRNSMHFGDMEKIHSSLEGVNKLVKRPESSREKARRASCEVSIVLNETFTRPSSSQSTFTVKSYCDKSTNSSPIPSVDAKTSPIETMSISREHQLKHEIEQLQEKLKDTEERLQSLRIQHDSLSQLHRDLRENHTHLQEESELLKLDVQHLNECANILRSELQSARNDRNEALEVQKILQTELEDSRCEKKRAQEQNEKDSKTIQDLQRQCREMERILMRKHPDSVSALIVAARNPSKSSEDNMSSRRLLEQRIAQLESDAKEQDIKAQKILANVQARFNSVQSKYETHIADLETQVLSLQEINTKLNEKIESQILALNKIAKSNNNVVNNCTQTDDIAERESIRTSTTSTQTDSTSRPNSSLRQTPPLKKSSTGKMPASHSDTTISAYHAAAKEDAHLLATIRGMRVDLAIKDKAMQRLTRELDECKKTIKKLQKERDSMKSDRLSSASSSSSSRKPYDPNQYADQSADSQALKEALNKIKLLEFDYKALHDKRLQDLKTLQAAHERELSSCHETVRILQQRLAERDEAFNNQQKRRKVPIDYYALKAKVSSLERRHTEREQRLHMLVEALSKGRLNGALEEILTDNTQ